MKFSVRNVGLKMLRQTVSNLFRKTWSCYRLTCTRLTLQAQTLCKRLNLYPFQFSPRRLQVTHLSLTPILNQLGKTFSTTLSNYACYILLRNLKPFASFAYRLCVSTASSQTSINLMKSYLSPKPWPDREPT